MSIELYTQRLDLTVLGAALAVGLLVYGWRRWLRRRRKRKLRSASLAATPPPHGSPIRISSTEPAPHGACPSRSPLPVRRPRKRTARMNRVSRVLWVCSRVAVVLER